MDTFDVAANSVARIALGRGRNNLGINFGRRRSRPRFRTCIEKSTADKLDHVVFGKPNFASWEDDCQVRFEMEKVIKTVLEKENWHGMLEL